MTKKWINWNENELINESDTDFVIQLNLNF